jgi:hypothetical protein
MLKRQEALTFRAHMHSVNKSFPNVSRQKEVVTVRYPVELTALKGKITTIFNEKTTLSLHVQNTSSADLGLGSPQKRRVFVIFEITEVEAVKSKDVELITEQIFEEKESQDLNKVAFEIGHLPANRKEFFAVSFRFTNPDLKTRSKVGVTASLYLEQVNSDQVRCIQKQSIQISLSESYRYNPMADLLLVTHSGVTMEELECWDHLFNGMRLAYSIWNASYYNHLNFSKRIGEETLQSHFAGKTVIILNHPPLKDLLPKQEILRIGKSFNINTYIAGENIAPKEQCELQRVDITDIAAQTLHGRVFFESSLAKEFDSEVKEFAERLCKTNPIRKYVIVKSFGPQKVDGLFKHALGTVKVCCTGQLNRASVLSVPFNSSGSQMIESPQNRYGVLKMLHFERKLSLLESIPKSSRQLLEDAIISDLADEQYVVGQCQWTKEDLPVLKSHLEQLNIFLTTPWKIAENEELKASVRRVMLQSRAFVNCNFKTKNQFHALVAASEQLIDAGFKAVFGIQDAWQEEYKAHYYEPLLKISSREVLEMTRNPRFKAFYQDNWEGRSQIKSLEDLL